MMWRRPGRPLTEGETALLRSIYADGIDYECVRIHDRRWFWPLPHDRAMAPNGHCYFPGGQCVDDFATDPSLARRALFVHEGAHLYQRYAMRWRVWLRGSFDRRYAYRLMPGRAYQDYGLEQMGMIAQHYYTLREGGRIALSYTLTDYEELLPLRPGLP